MAVRESAVVGDVQVTPLMCLSDSDSWKLFIERANDSTTLGMLVALNGINGNVAGRFAPLRAQDSALFCVRGNGSREPRDTLGGDWRGAGHQSDTPADDERLGGGGCGGQRNEWIQHAVVLRRYRTPSDTEASSQRETCECWVANRDSNPRCTSATAKSTGTMPSAAMKAITQQRIIAPIVMPSTEHGAMESALLLPSLANRREGGGPSTCVVAHSDSYAGNNSRRLAFVHPVSVFTAEYYLVDSA